MKPVEILLIEDNPGDIRLTMDAFKQCTVPNHIRVVKDGCEAVNYLKRRRGYQDTVRPDMIILDLNVPKKDGKDVLKEIKANRDLGKIPVLVLTCSNKEEDIAQCYEHHANCYIRKPLDFDSFLDVVKKIEEFWMATVKLPPNT